MLNSGKACSTVSKRTIPHCGLKPQLKECVEHDCYIYTWNSACTMEGIDMAMVWNTLLNDTSGGVKCAGCSYLQNVGGHLGVHCGCYLQEGAREEQTGTGTDKVGMRLYTSISRPWLFWVKQSRQRRWGG